MKKLLPLLLLVAGCVSVAPRPHPAMSVVAVVVDQSYGTGFVVSGNRIVTAAHVARAPGLLLVVQNGKAYPATIVTINDETDVAVLAAGIEAPWLELADGPAEMGEDVWSFGFPFSGPELLWPARGVAASPARVRMGVGPGASGSPVLDSEGKVVGLLRAHHSDDNSLTLMATLDALREALK